MTLGLLVEVELQSFYNFGNIFRCMVSVTPDHITPWGNVPYTHRTGGCVGLRISLYAVVKTRISSAGNRTAILQSSCV
jgi:hypothetical protein